MTGYALELTPDDNGTFLATCPRLPEVTSFGASADEAIANAGRAIEEALAARIAAKEEVPTPAQYAAAGRPVARLSLQASAKISLYAVLQRRGVSRAELARRLGWHRESVDRLFRLGHGSRLEQIEAAFEALGADVQIYATTDERDAMERGEVVLA